MIYEPRKYQEVTTSHILDNKSAGLFLDMGLGKTVSSLTAFEILKYDMLEASKALVIAPKKVAQFTWPAEILKWDHLQHLSYTKVLGTEKQRKKALEEDVDLYLINRENVSWIVAHYGGGYMPFDTLIIDESSSFKNAESQRFRALKQVTALFKRVIILTGTPTPNGLHEIWPQMYLLDKGERLGAKLLDFRRNFCFVDQRTQDRVLKYGVSEIASKVLYEKISDICISMKSEDYIELPELMKYTINVEFSAKLREQYDDFLKERIMEMLDSADGGVVTAVNAAVLTGKLGQFANGAIYDEDKKVHKIHDLKLEALEDLVEAANGDPILCFYKFKHDLARIRASKKIGGLVRELKTEQDLEDWNRGKITLLLVHPASAGHGLNLQEGGCTIVWFGVPWSLEMYLQAMKRLHRPGQTRPVKMYHIVSLYSVESRVLKSLESKKEVQDDLLEAVKALVDRFKKLKA